MINNHLARPSLRLITLNDIALREVWEGTGFASGGDVCGGASPSGALGPSDGLGGPAVQDRSIEFGRAPRHWPHGLTTGADLVRCSRLRDKPLAGPTAPWVAGPSHRALLEAHRALDTPGTLGPPPTYLRIHRPEGLKGEGRRGQDVPCSTTHRRGRGFGLASRSRLLCVPASGQATARAIRARNELPPSHSPITSSARASTSGGIVRPSALAVLRLMARSNLVG